MGRQDTETVGYTTERWVGGQPFATWYDKYGRSRRLPADPYSLEHYHAQGLTLTPPESPVPLVEDSEYLPASKGEAPIPSPEMRALVEQATIEEDRIAELERKLAEATEAITQLRQAETPRRKGRGPDKKPRKKRGRKRNPA